MNSFTGKASSMEKSKIQKRMGYIIYGSAAVLCTLLAIYLVWSLRTLILPSIIGALSAYICTPLLRFLKRKGVPRGFGILFFFALFFLILFFIGGQIKDIIPDERGKLELRVRIQYKLNEKYREFMGIDSTGTKGNFVYNMVGKEVNPFMDNLNNMLMFSDEERELFEKYGKGYKGLAPIDSKFRGYYYENLKRDKKRLGEKIMESKEETDEAALEEEEEESKLSAIINIISLWIVMPFVFLFLLIDDGHIKKNMVSLIPNKYFEVALTVIDNVDEAIGNYLRGTVLECSLVGVTFIICLAIIGVDIKWAVIIGIVAGTANAIPFLGPAIGLIVGAGYALIAEEANSLLPFFNANNLIIGVFITVAIAQGMDNAVFQPIVLGGAVNLHPLVVIIGVMGGSIMFGFVGMLFAVPAIVVFKVIFDTTFKQMKAYYII
jgi:predicted PurR-regulated permease PerM